MALAVLMLIQDLLVDPARRERFSLPQANALTERGALQEAQLLDVRLDALRSAAWLLFDCRGALQIEQTANTAIVAAHGVRRCVWDAMRPLRLTAWSVVDSHPRVVEGLWTLSLAFAPNASLQVEALSAEFYVGDVPGCDGPPPDYTDGDEATVRQGTPSWSSTLKSVHAAFLDRG